MLFLGDSRLVAGGMERRYSQARSFPYCMKKPFYAGYPKIRGWKVDDVNLSGRKSVRITWERSIARRLLQNSIRLGLLGFEYGQR